MANVIVSIIITTSTRRPPWRRHLLTSPSLDNHTLSTLFKRARAPHIFAPLGNEKHLESIGCTQWTRTYTRLVGRTTRRNTRHVVQADLYSCPALHRPRAARSGKDPLVRARLSRVRARKYTSLVILGTGPLRMERTRQRDQFVLRSRRSGSALVVSIWQ